MLCVRPGSTLIGSVVNLFESWGDHQRIYSASLILVLVVCCQRRSKIPQKRRLKIPQ